MRASEQFRAYLASLPDRPERVERLWRDADGQPVGRVYGTHLGSAFQPVLRLADGVTVAWDALIRTHGSEHSALHPWNVFALAASEHELVELDRLCRVVHTLGYFSRIESGEPLHVKVHERLLRAVAEHHGQTYRRILDRLGVARDAVVIELPGAVVDNHRLVGAVAYSYRLNGFPVAVNFGRREPAALEALLAECSFDILKPWAPPPSLRAEREAARLVGLADARQLGIIYTRVETAQQLDLVRAAGARHAQGHALGHPASRPENGRLPVPESASA